MLCSFGDSHGALLAVQARRPDYIEFGRSQIDLLRSPVPNLDFARATEALGIPLLQGNSIGALDPAPKKRLRKKRFCGAADSDLGLVEAQTATVAGLATEIPPVYADYSVEEVGEVFHAARQLQTLPVVEGNRPRERRPLGGDRQGHWVFFPLQRPWGKTPRHDSFSGIGWL
ncbi:MAG: hypothetical protein VBE63_03840 [Lamprobacter sp.]|uniref:hypothetical protein n=1 Tax=Lamprobacter sp. TaxID=3100796 RepID=UPI002B25E43E|nr:hypothetical protein [Lamprobacter sp.]MEA3639056.1 hypothetical protein [Lamprobacter sp.]